jgi:transposase-like protein
MTEDTMAFLDQTQKRGGGDFLKELAEAVLQGLMEFDVEGRIGAGRCERSDERTTQRNGFRERSCDTRLGALELKIPKLRKGSYFPVFLEPRKTAERALVAVVQEGWIQGVSTRKVDDLVKAMGKARTQASGRSQPWPATKSGLALGCARDGASLVAATISATARSKRRDFARAIPARLTAIKPCYWNTK